MDIRIGNDIRIDVTLENLGIRDIEDIVSVECLLTNTTHKPDPHVDKLIPNHHVNHHASLHHPSKYSIVACGAPTYNVYPYNSLAHHFFVVPKLCGTCFHHDFDHHPHHLSPEKKLIHADVYLSKDDSSIHMYYPAKDQLCGKHELTLIVTTTQQEWGHDRMHTCTFDYGSVFKVVKDEFGECGSIIITLPPYRNFSSNINKDETFSFRTYSIIANPDRVERGFVSGGGTYKLNEQAQLVAMAYPNYEFICWNDGDTSAVRTITVRENATYVAYFRSTVYDSESYTVTFYDEDGITVLKQTTQQYGSAIVAPHAPAKEGYTFSHWTPDVAAVVPNHDVSYVAVYVETRQNFTISVSSADETMGTVTGGGEVASGSSVTVMAIPNEGYKFVKWSNDITENPYTFTATSDINLVAQFEPRLYQITFFNDDNTIISQTEQAYGSVLIVPDNPTKDDYTFAGWYPVPPYTVPAKDSSYTATFSKDAVFYTITVQSEDIEKGTVSGGGRFIENSQCTITATANTGYIFKQWNDGNTESIRTITVTQDVTYTAQFEKNIVYYIIEVQSEDTAKGTVSGSGTYVEGSQCTITATANTGYKFTRWTDGNTSSVRTITVTHDVTYVAQFEEVVAEEPKYWYGIKALSDVIGQSVTIDSLKASSTARTTNITTPFSVSMTAQVLYLLYKIGATVSAKVSQNGYELTPNWKENSTRYDGYVVKYFTGNGDYSIDNIIYNNI